MFSKACEYGIKAIIYIATQSLKGERVKTGDIVENVGSPVAFTAKILGALTKHNIVDSYTGPYGGFEIHTARMKTIKLSEIVFAIDGDIIGGGDIDKFRIKIWDLNNNGEIVYDNNVADTDENAETLVSSSTEFDTWLNEVVFDLDNFRSKPKEAAIPKAGKVLQE